MKHIGLVLSGGLGKGAYQVGALAALREYFKPTDFDIVSAASIGALNTYAYLTGILDKSRELWESADFKGSMRSVVSVMRSSFLKNIISDNVDDTSIPVPFYVPLFDTSTKKLDYYNFSELEKEELESYFLASISLPIVNRGVEVGGHVFFDGGAIDNIPVFPLMNHGLDYIICIYFDEMFVFEDPETDRKMIKITFPDDTIISNSVDIKHESIMYMMDSGYKKTKQILSEVFSQGTDNLDVIYENIARLDAGNNRKLRITMDVVISNLNRILQKTGRRKRRTENIQINEPTD